MNLKFAYVGIILLASGFINIANASLITIDFEGFNTGSFSNGVEDGVVITTTGDTRLIISDPRIGSGNFMASAQCCSHSTLYNFTLQSGEIFSFVQFDLGGYFEGGDDVVVEGFLGGISQGVDSFHTTTSPLAPFAVEGATNLLGVGIDELTIRLFNGRDFPMMDNIVLNDAVQVPEPSTLAIFALGMLGLASRRMKKQY
jgi:hypothetical protein